MNESVNAAHIALERLVYQAHEGARFTQDSPVLQDVWISYGSGGGVHDLLLVPNWKSSAVALASELRARLRRGPTRPDGADPSRAAMIAYTQSTVAARLTLAELLWATLPLSRWWHRYLIEPSAGDPAGDVLTLWRGEATRPNLKRAILEGLSELRRPGDARRGYLFALDTGEPIRAKNRGARHITADLVWLVDVAGTLLRVLSEWPQGLQMCGGKSARAMTAMIESLRADPEAVLQAFFGAFDLAPPQPSPKEVMWSVNRNREGSLAMFRSTATVKADAARKVFGVTGAGIRWAVVDSGIDARHVAFRKRSSSGDIEPEWTEGTRVVATYDFSKARALLSEHADETLGALGSDAAEAAGEARPGLHAQPALRSIDWNQWEDRLRIPHDADYPWPTNKHGTHVAGILAADWRPGDDEDDALSPSIVSPEHEQVRTGVCPQLELYDVRVTNEAGVCDEFSLIAALQFIRSLNSRHDHVEVAGVNLSLSLLHDVANYACGRTPVCDECERLVASGMVVVAAAGNQGRTKYLTSDGELDEGYRSISITDPGNAPSVITVGATHRLDPHGYGVSYFSSRGPTGDGRLKPDLVAPGEKVISTVPDNLEEAMDGTSMAAPHVSGAAAMILARHPELIGRPAEIKRILCSTAVDLGRERYFQGAGLLDILHALESI